MIDKGYPSIADMLADIDRRGFATSRYSFDHGVGAGGIADALAITIYDWARA